MIFNHIREVWNYLEQAENYADLLSRIGDIPNKFGSWDVERNDNGQCIVTNTYYDKACDEWQEESEDLDIDYLDYLTEEK